MRSNGPDLPLLGVTALAPIIWGTTYLVTREMLPAGIPLTIALLRALPADLVLRPPGTGAHALRVAGRMAGK